MMMTRFARLTVPLVLAAALAGCSMSEVPTARLELVDASRSTSASKMAICHWTDEEGHREQEIQPNAWRGHRGHGDYALELIVDHDAKPGDGIQFRRITDALSAADSTRRAHGEKNAGACRITIRVSNGEYKGSFTASTGLLERLPLLVMVPDVSLVGAYSMQLDSDRRALGVTTGGSSTIVPTAGMVTNDALVVIGADSAGFRGDRAVVQGFRFSSGFDTTGATSGGIGVGAMRVRDLLVTGNKFDPTLSSSVDVRASSAIISRNHGRRLAVCGICLAGPGKYVVTENRVLDGGFTAVFAAPIAILPHFTKSLYPGVRLDSVTALAISADTTTIINNDLSDHVRQVRGVGSGIRVVSFSADAPNAIQQTQVTIARNRLVGNNFAIDVDANTPTTPPAGYAVLALDLTANTIGPSCRNNVVVSFTRVTRTIPFNNTVTNQSYLNNSAYTLSLGGNTLWDNAWYDSSQGVNNRLMVDGVDIPAGKRIAPSDNPAGC